MNIIGKHSTADLDTVRLNYNDKKYGDITRIRAIAITDDRICWVDDANYKKSHAISFARKNNGRNTRIEKDKEEFLKHYSIEPQKLRETLLKGVTVLQPEDDPKEERGFWGKIGSWFSRPDNDLKIELPRVLSKANPLFSLNPIDHEDPLSPKSNEIFGTRIRLEFDYEPAYEEVLSLYIYNDVQNYRMDIIYRGEQSEVQTIQAI
jgi:hypothetical protein